MSSGAEPEAPEPSEASAEQIAERHLRRNFGLLIGEAGAFMAGLAFFDTSTVVPLLLAKLGASDVVIGALRFVLVLGFTLPALVAAHRIHGRPTHKRFLLITASLSRVGLCTIPVVLLLAARERPALALWWTFGTISLFAIMDGACAVSWYDILAKTIPARMRGRFFGVMQTTAGLFAISAGVVVHWVLRSPRLPYPVNFALLGGLWFLAAMLSQAGLALIHEPPGPAVPSERRLGFLDYLKQTVPLLRSSARLRGLIVTRILLDGAGMAGPFYILYAQRDLGVSLQMAGVYTMAQNAGRVLTGPLWGWVSDRLGTHVAIRAIGLFVLLAPVLAFAAVPGRPELMLLVFFVLGAVGDGMWMVMSTALLESVAPDERPLAVGVASVCQTPSALYAPAGGLLSGLTSYRVVFVTGALFALFGLVLAMRIPPRGPVQQA